MTGQRFNVIQKAPFCWQDKSACRFIRANLKRTSARNAIDVYRALSELASDDCVAEGRWAYEEIADKACMSDKPTSRALKDLERLGIIEIVPGRNALGHPTPSLVILLTHEERARNAKNPSRIFTSRESTPPQQVVAGGIQDQQPQTEIPGRQFTSEGLKKFNYEEESLLAADAAERDLASPPPPKTKTFLEATWERLWSQTHSKLGEYPYGGKSEKVFLAELEFRTRDNQLAVMILSLYLADGYHDGSNHPLWQLKRQYLRYLGQAVKKLTKLRSPKPIPVPDVVEPREDLSEAEWMAKWDALVHGRNPNAN